MAYKFLVTMKTEEASVSHGQTVARGLQVANLMVLIGPFEGLNFQYVFFIIKYI